MIFAHGSARARPRNKFVADILVKAGLATLLFDLLTFEEDADYDNRFDIDLLTDRLKSVTLWLNSQPETSCLALGYFGASTGTASALRAAAEPGSSVKAVVSRGGRPDLAGEALSRVRVPVLLIVGGMEPYAYHRFSRIHGIDPMPDTIAKEIAKNAEQYPGYLVAAAEIKCRDIVSSKIVRVGDIAARDKWFTQ